MTLITQLLRNWKNLFSIKVRYMSQLYTDTFSVLLGKPIAAENIFRETGLLSTCLVKVNNFSPWLYFGNVFTKNNIEFLPPQTHIGFNNIGSNAHIFCVIRIPMSYFRFWTLEEITYFTWEPLYSFSFGLIVAKKFITKKILGNTSKQNLYLFFMKW